MKDIEKINVLPSLGNLRKIIDWKSSGEFKKGEVINRICYLVSNREIGVYEFIPKQPIKDSCTTKWVLEITKTHAKLHKEPNKYNIEYILADYIEIYLSIVLEKHRKEFLGKKLSF